LGRHEPVRSDVPLERLAAAAVVVNVFAIDFCVYVQHVVMHSVPALWRIHRVHHADVDLDASSALRTHPIELLLLLSTPSVVMTLAGIPILSLAIYNVIALPFGIERFRGPADQTMWQLLRMPFK
jgi:sterol desaturase/sphingolipid hydroxylase (fatty acid hydroxylase superfamily)